MAPSSADLTQLEQGSDVVVKATFKANSSAVDSASGDWLTPLFQVTTLGKKASGLLPPVKSLIDATDPSDSYIPGTYILFLRNDAPSPYYTPTEGLQGMFRINGADVLRQCPNYGGATLLTASAAPGGVTTLAKIQSMIPAVLPAYDRPTKTASPVVAPASTSP